MLENTINQETTVISTKGLAIATTKTYEIREGATKCNTTDPQSVPFSWTFAESESKLTFQNSTATIDVLSETSLVITYTDNYFTPARYNRLTFRH